MKIQHARRRAFTLIEILVVIGIIGLLAALLFPVFAQAREEARKTTCLSNMRQLGLAFQQYANDSRGKYPLSGNFQAWAPGYGHWVSGEAGDDKSLVSIVFPPSAATPPSELAKPDFQRAAKVTDGSIFSYVKSTQVYVCPSAQYNTQLGLSYSMNCAMSGVTVARTRAPGDIVLLVDEQYPTDGFFYARGICKPGENACSTDALQDRHNGGGNLLFADGHVKFFRNEAFPLDYSTQGLINKSRLTGTPRFHDRGFGSPNGSSLLGFQNKPGQTAKDADALDSCAVKISAPDPVPGAPVVPVVPPAGP